MVPLRPTRTPQDHPKTRLFPSTNPKSSSTPQKLGLEVGYRFHPTDLELVDYYLQSRYAMGDKFQSHFVTECPEFYSENEPWVIWHMYSGDDDSKNDKTLYFFTGTRPDRKVGSGSWSGQYIKEIKDRDGVVVGIKREFRYEGCYDEDHNGAWLMQEYQIVDDDSHLVLCALRRNPRKPPPPTSDQTRMFTSFRLLNVTSSEMEV